MRIVFGLIYSESYGDTNRNCESENLRAEKRSLNLFNSGVTATQLRAPPEEPRRRQVCGTCRNTACAAESLRKQNQILACATLIRVRTQL